MFLLITADDASMMNKMKINTKCLFRTSYLNFTTSIVYVLLYRCIHIHFLMYYFHYFGYCDNTLTSYEQSLTNLIAIFPILFYSGEKKISNFVSILIYILVYVPTVVTIQYYFHDYPPTISYQLLFMFAIILFFLSEKFKIGSREIITKTNKIPLQVWLLIGVSLSFFVYLSYGSGALRIVSLSDVYDVREDNMSIVSGNPFLGYAVLWLTYFFIPLFAAIGLFQHKKLLVVASIFFAVLVYSSSGSKAAISSPVFVIGFFLMLKHIGFKYLFPVIVFAFGLVFVICQIWGDSNNLVFVLSSILLMRTLSISGLLGAGYIDFFNSNPFTHYSHIGIVNKLTGAYPYDAVLGKAVWAGVTGKDAAEIMNANANFLVTDGVASCGLLGVFIISIVFFFLLIYMNNLSARHDQNFVFMLLLGSILSLLNVSLFTTLLSCGLLIIFVFLRYTTIDIKNK